jgi:uncharacterized protein YqgV (UPF0045/DUF77 family)
MKRMTLTCLVTIGAFVLSPAFAQTQTPSAEQQVAAALKEVQAQQAKMAANQTQIDAKLATLAEAIRVARIYASRGGK